MGAEEFEASHVASAAATVVPSAGIDVMKDAAKKHLQSVFEKLGVRRRALVALRPRLAALDPPRQSRLWPLSSNVRP